MGDVDCQFHAVVAEGTGRCCSVDGGTTVATEDTVVFRRTVSFWIFPTQIPLRWRGDGKQRYTYVAPVVCVAAPIGTGASSISIDMMNTYNFEIVHPKNAFFFPYGFGNLFCDVNDE